MDAGDGTNDEWLKDRPAAAVGVVAAVAPGAGTLSAADAGAAGATETPTAGATETPTAGATETPTVGATEAGHLPARARPLRLLVADRAATRLGIRMALGEGVEICAEAGNATQAIRAAKREQPDVCLIARELEGDGIVAVRAISRAAPSCAIVVMADNSDADQMLQAIHAGAMGYLPGGISPDRLNNILYAVDAREAVLPRALVTELLLELRAAGGESAGLTSREAQVLGMVRRGHSTSGIANRLGITPVTVRRHISALVSKLGVEDRSALLTGGTDSGSRAPL